MRESKISLYSGIAFLVYGIALFIGAGYIQSSSASGIGPGFMPKIVGIFIAAVSAIMILLILFKKSSTQGKKEKSDKAENKFDIKTTCLTILLLIAYVALMKPVGFLITSTIYMFLQMALLSKKNTKKSLIIYGIISVGSSLVIDYVFVNFFALMLPGGILG